MNAAAFVPNVNARPFVPGQPYIPPEPAPPSAPADPPVEGSFSVYHHKISLKTKILFIVAEWDAEVPDAPAEVIEESPPAPEPEPETKVEKQVG